MMKKILYLLPILTLLLIGAKQPPRETIEFTIINKAERGIAISLKGQDWPCTNSCDTLKGQIYYLTVPAGTNESPSVKTFEIEKNTYGMQLYYIQTWDPVYGFKCPIPKPNALMAIRNLRLTVLPCDQSPKCPKAIGEPSMWKYLPFAAQTRSRFLNKYWFTRLIY